MHPSRQHYNEYPYDVGVEGGEQYVSSATPLGRFIEATAGADLVADVGCGPGNLLAALRARFGLVVGLDISDMSVRLARRSECASTVSVIQADACRLPFRGDHIDVIVATGSLHHTADAESAFYEVARVLRPGGSMFVSLYRAGSYYDRMYRTVGALARRAHRSRLLDRVVNDALLVPAFGVYFWLGRFVLHRSRPRLGRRQLRNYFADQLLNPTVSFHSEEQLRRWAANIGLSVHETTTQHAGALLAIVMVKAAPASNA